MTELKIKQADINNNGNQRLMGNTTGGGVKLKICIMYGCGCTHAGKYGEGAVTFVTAYFFSLSTSSELENLKYINATLLAEQGFIKKCRFF